MGAALKRQVSVFTPRNHVLRPQVVSSRYLASFPGHEKIPGFRLPGKDPPVLPALFHPEEPGDIPASVLHRCGVRTIRDGRRWSLLPRPRAGYMWCAGRKGPSHRGVNTQKTLIDALENELVSIREQKAKLSQREAAIVKTLSTYTGTGQAVIRATREMNTVDMARTVIRNAGRPMKSKGRPR